MNSYLKNILLPAILVAMSAAAQAQYVWVDEKGVKQFSDQPPPASVPANRILKAPDQRAASSGEEAQATDAPPAPKPPSLAARNEEYNKRRAEQAEKDKKAEEARQMASDKSKVCERSKAYLRDLESGARISTTDANGEKKFLSDDERSKEIGEAKHNMQSCTN
jgi:hypothetical protein